MKGVDSLNHLEDSGESLIFFYKQNIQRSSGNILSENVFLQTAVLNPRLTWEIPFIFPWGPWAFGLHKMLQCLFWGDIRAWDGLAIVAPICSLRRVRMKACFCLGSWLAFTWNRGEERGNGMRNGNGNRRVWGKVLTLSLNYREEARLMYIPSFHKYLWSSFYEQHFVLVGEACLPFQIIRKLFTFTRASKTN